MVFMVTPAPKPTHKRNKTKRKARGEFSANTRKHITERDNGLCVKCGIWAVHIHHVIYRSAGGGNEATNGICVCRSCHEYAHMSREGRVWFEQYRESHLLNER